MKTYRIYKTIELRATVEAEDEAAAREIASTLEDDDAHEIEYEDWGIIS